MVVFDVVRTLFVLSDEQKNCKNGKIKKKLIEKLDKSEKYNENVNK